MKKITFTYNSCICMILILLCVECIILYMHGGAWRVCRAFLSVQKKWKEGLTVLGMYLAKACTRGEFPSILDVSN